jgi:hypothetical protein
MISSFVQPLSSNLDTICSAIKQSMVLMKNGAGQIYWPAYGINTIGDWSYSDGYQIYMQSDDTIAIQGIELQPAASSISLIQGWNMVSYLQTSSMWVDSALASIAATLVIAKNNSGEVYWPTYDVNTIGAMNPGQGYQLCVSQASVLTYPAYSPTSSSSVVAFKNFVNQRNTCTRTSKDLRGSELLKILTHFTFASNTGNNATIAIPAASNPSAAGVPLASGDEIGAFTPSGLCIGAIMWTGANTAITVWGDNDQTPSIDGIRGGEQISYHIWQQSTNTEFTDANVTYTQGNGLYQANGIYALSSLSAGTTDISDSKDLPREFSLSQNYPNPFNPSTVIKYTLPVETMVTLDVYDVVGRRTALLVNQEQKAGYHEIVFQNPNLESGVYLYRLQTPTFVSVRKMLVLR